MKRFAMAFAVTLVLSAATFAGDIPTGVYTPPDPDQPAQPLVTSVPGDMPTGGVTQEGSTEITLTVVQAILSLLSL
ncbi:MAG: hypothetical protein QOD75_2313 [Blastocatellia bacterium]|jgi:hypothetical protein|nr:hypothetical protein [Blastocatellia bacterium]